MPQIGKTNILKVVKLVSIGAYLDGMELGEILIPNRYLPVKCEAGQTLSVFLYRDSEDRLIATTEKPFAEVGDFALLEVVSLSPFGAFLDWGLPKQLLVPFREQAQRMTVGKNYLVRVYFDELSGRIAASSKLEKFLDQSTPEYKESDPVQLIIYHRTELGFKTIINKQHEGFLFKDDVFQPLQMGDRLNGFIKKMRSDGKIDVCLQKPGYEKVDDLSQKILEQLKSHGGFIPVTDKSTPQYISKLFGVSKKTYKKAVGALYKKRLILIEEEGIKLVPKKSQKK